MNPLPPLPPFVVRFVTVVGLLSALLCAAFYAFKQNSLLLLAGLFASPLLLFFVNNPASWFVLVLGLYYSWIYLPGLNTTFSLFYIMAACLLPILLVSRTINPPQVSIRGRLRAGIAAYGLLVLITILVRGFGIRILGSEMWGGGSYVSLFIVMGFYLLSDSIVLTERQWRVAVILYCSAGLLPSVAEILFILSKGRLSWMYFVVRPEGISALTSLNVMEGGSGVLRFQISKYISMFFVMSLALWSWRSRRRLIIILFFLLAVAFAGLSGHRIAFFYLVLFIPAMMYFSTRRLPIHLLSGYFAALLVTAMFLHFFGRALPLPFQRAVSWVPFADISPLARQSAVGSLEWRISVLERIMEELPRYWLIGKGFAFQVSDMYALKHMLRRDVEWAIITHNYHNGPLSMLLDLGVFGLILGPAIIIGGAVRHIRLLSRDWATSSLARYHRAFLAFYCADMTAIFLVHGDACFSIIGILVQLVVLDGVWRTDQHRRRKEEERLRDTPLPA